MPLPELHLQHMREDDRCHWFDGLSCWMCCQLLQHKGGRTADKIQLVEVESVFFSEVQPFVSTKRTLHTALTWNCATTKQVTGLRVESRDYRSRCTAYIQTVS